MELVGCSETENKLEVFVSGAEIAGVNGIIFGPDGYLYATSVIGSDISVVDTENKKNCEKIWIGRWSNRSDDEN